MVRDVLTLDAFTTGELIAFWAGITALATVFIAGSAVVFGLAENAKKTESEERTERERRADRQDRALERASTLRVTPQGSEHLLVANVGNYTFTDVEMRRFDHQGADVVQNEPIDYGQLGPGQVFITGEPDYWMLRYIDSHGRVFQNEGLGPSIVFDPDDEEMV